MCYHILQQNGQVVSRSTVQQVTQLKLQTCEYREMFNTFDINIKDKIKCKERYYDGAKPHPEDWADLFECNSDFNDEFNKIYNYSCIDEADTHTPEVLEDTYINMELAMPRDSDGPEFARVTKRLRDTDGIPIGTSNDNPILDSRLYEVGYTDGHKASLAANIIAINMFAQVDQ